MRPVPDASPTYVPDQMDWGTPSKLETLRWLPTWSVQSVPNKQGSRSNMVRRITVRHDHETLDRFQVSVTDKTGTERVLEFSESGIAELRAVVMLLESVVKGESK